MPDFGAFTKPRPMSLTVDLAGEPCELVFDANRVTKAWMDQRIAEALAEAVTSWNMTENGQPLEPSVETFDRMPYPALHALMRSVIDASTPASEEGNGSSGPTSTPPSTSSEPSRTPLNGMETSKSVELSESLSPT